MSKIKEVSSFDGTSWGTAVPLGAEDANIDITSSTQNPADSSSTLDSLTASDVTVASGDTGAGAWTKYNRFRKKVVNNLDLRKKTVALTTAEYEALEQAGTVDNDTIYLLTDDTDYENLTPTIAISKNDYDNLSAADKAKDVLYNIIDDETSANFQPLITASGILQGNGGGGITAKAVDNTPTSGSSNLVTSGGVKSALTGVGSVGGVVLTSSDNLNNILLPGFYSWAYSSKPTNYPLNAASSMIVTQSANNRVQQMVITDGDTYQRYFKDNVWSSWVLLATKSDLQQPFNTSYPSDSSIPFTPTVSGIAMLIIVANQSSGGIYRLSDLTGGLPVLTVTAKANSYAAGWFYAIANHNYSMASDSDSYYGATIRFFPFSP